MLPRHLTKSRHGVFYFRLSFRMGATTKEKRISLQTKIPQEARFKAMCLSGIMTVRTQEQQRATDYLNTEESIAGQAPDGDFQLNLLHCVDREQLAELAGLPLPELNNRFTPSTEPDTRRLGIEMLGGFVLRNINSDDDVSRAVQILQSLNQ